MSRQVTALEPPTTAVPAGPPPPPPPGPIAQSVAIGFRSVYVAVLLLALLWLVSNVREIAPGSQAVVLRFGRIVRAQEAGLLLAWPRPIEQVELLPGSEQQLTQEVAALAPPTEQSQALIGRTAGGGSLPADESAYLTGDGNIVLLNATIIYRISDPIAYALAQRHVAAALDRLFRAATVLVTAGQSLNDFLVVTSAGQIPNSTPGASPSAAGQSVMAMRAAVRQALLESVNHRLGELATEGAALGVEVDRIDMTAWLPPKAKSAFDAVLLAAQAADRGIAQARTDAEHRRQDAVQLSQQLVSFAQAGAEELVSNARVDTAGILALEREETPATRESLLWRDYRAKIASIMDSVGSATLVDPRSGARFLWSGSQLSSRPQK